MKLNPLKPEHLETCNKLLKACHETGEYLQACKECELDVDDEMRVNAEQQRIATKIKARFFPDKP